MRPPDEARASAQVWLEYAARDLKAAEVLLGVPDMAGAVCFHAQQAAEKTLKAYLVSLGEEEIPRTHDITHLSRLIVQRGAAEPPQHGLKALDQHAVATRYPEVEAPTEQEASEAVRLARELLEFVRQALSISENAPPM